MKKGLYIIFVITILLSCHRKNPVLVENNNSLNQLILDHETWKSQRLSNLMHPYGWLSLVGLSWMKNGENLMGSGDACQIKLNPEFPALLGRIHLTDSIFFEADKSGSIFQNGKAFDSGILSTDAHPNYTVLNYRSLQWYVIERNNKYAIRIKDSLSTVRTNFSGIQYFPYAEDMVFEVEVEEVINDSINITNVLGMESQNRIAAYLNFSFDGRKYKLAALDGGPQNYFLIISDNTSGFSTYGGGRYISVARPAERTKLTHIDFNRSYNPPCVFTDFATCPLPPKSNHLYFEVRAGERKYHD